MIHRVLQRALAALSLCAATAASAQTWPNGPIKLIVPFPPGGSVDIVARAVGKYLGAELGQPVVVDNRGGASGNIGAEAAARAAPDGQTLLVYSSGILAANPFLFKRTGFDAHQDFTQVVRLVEQPNILLVHPSVPVNNVKEFIDYLKSKPGDVTMGNAGIGTGQDIAARQFTAMAGVEVLHVPYRGGAPALSDLLGGQILSMFETSPTALQYALEGEQLRALAVTSAKRSPLLPKLPTMDEAGVPGYASVTWMGLAAPAGTPQPIIDRLNGILNKLIAGDLGKQFSEIALEPGGGTQQEVIELLQRDSDEYERILKAAGIEPQ